MRMIRSQEGSVSVKAESGLCLHQERSSAFWREPVVSKATEMKMSDCQCIDSYNEKDSCGQSGVFMSVDLQVTSLQASDKGSQPWPGGGSRAHTRTRVAPLHNSQQGCSLHRRLSLRQRCLKDRCLLAKVWSENICIPIHRGI